MVRSVLHLARSGRVQKPAPVADRGTSQIAKNERHLLIESERGGKYRDWQQQRAAALEAARKKFTVGTRVRVVSRGRDVLGTVLASPPPSENSRGYFGLFKVLLDGKTGDEEEIVGIAPEGLELCNADSTTHGDVEDDPAPKKIR